MADLAATAGIALSLTGRAGVDRRRDRAGRVGRRRCCCRSASGFACPERFGAPQRRCAECPRAPSNALRAQPDRVSRPLSPHADRRRQDNARRRVCVSRRSAAACRRLPTGARRRNSRSWFRSTAARGSVACPSDKSDFATWLASSGYVVIAIDYRHAPAWRWPAQIEDVNEALRWVGAHAHEYAGDTSRVVLMGRSAGAHLATMAAWFTTPIHVRGVVSYYGPVDLTEAYKHPPRPDPLRIRSVEEALLGAPLEQMPERYADASTITHIRAGTTPLVPTLLVYGGRDHIVEPKYGAIVVDALRARGTPVAYLEIPWADHAFDEVFNGPSSQIALYYTERFHREGDSVDGPARVILRSEATKDRFRAKAVRNSLACTAILRRSAPQDDRALLYA